MPIWTLTDTGRKSQNTVPSGILRVLQWTGCPIALATGRGWIPGVGPGSKMSGGASARFTMGAGSTVGVLGGGCPGHMLWRRCTLRLLLHLSEGPASLSALEQGELESQLGFHSGRASLTSLGTITEVTTCVRSISQTSGT